MCFNCAHMQKIKKILNVLKKKRVFIPLIILIIIIISILGKNNGTSNIVKAEIKDFEKIVSISGKVIPTEKAELSFETGGTVIAIRKDVGQKVYQGEAIAFLNSSDLQAEKQSAISDLEGAKAELEKLQNNNADTEVLANRQEVLNAIRSALTDSDDALNNKVDQFFKNPEDDNPTILYTFGDYFDLEIKINNGRSDIEKIFNSWSEKVDLLTIQNVSSNDVNVAKTNLYAIKGFLDLVSKAVNTFEVSNSLSQTNVDKYKSDIALARNNINEAISNLIKVNNTLRDSVSNIPVQESKVRSAEAKISKINAEIAKTVISSPFNGIVSEKTVELGQSVPPNEKMFTVIKESLEVEAFVPEVNLPGVALNNKVTIKLDAYSKDEFEGIVTHIDPAETLKDGVSNYKIKIGFVSQNEKIKSGMTADVWIVISKRENVLMIPLRAVTKEQMKDYVFVSNNKKESIKTEVVLGDTDGKGNVEVISGIENGQELVLNQV